MGDEAEGVFEAVSPLGSAVRYGWNRDAQFTFMSKAIAHTPDYYCNNGFLVEVFGMAGKESRGMKVTKWEAVRDYWSKMQETYFFIWNSRYKRWVLIHYDEMKKVVARSRRTHGVQAFENDGNEYYLLEWQWLTEAAEDGDKWEGS